MSYRNVYQVNAALNLHVTYNVVYCEDNSVPDKLSSFVSQQAHVKTTSTKSFTNGT